MLTFAGTLTPRITSEVDACEALRQLKEMQHNKTQVEARVAEQKKQLNDSIADDLAEIDREATEDLAVRVSGKPCSTQEYSALLESALESWALTMPEKTFNCPHGTIAVKDLPERIDAPGVDAKEREKNRKPICDSWLKKTAKAATEWLLESGLFPFFRIKFEMDMTAINKAWSAGQIKAKDLKRFGLELIKGMKSVTVKTA